MSGTWLEDLENKVMTDDAKAEELERVKKILTDPLVATVIYHQEICKVTCVNNEDSDYGLQDTASQYLNLGKTYSVYKVEIYGYHTSLELKEFPGQQFSDSHFDKHKFLAR